MLCYKTQKNNDKMSQSAACHLSCGPKLLQTGIERDDMLNFIYFTLIG